MRPVPWGELVALVRRAGEAILPHWRADVAVRSKADESPVTAADLAAHHILEADCGRWRRTFRCFPKRIARYR